MGWSNPTGWNSRGWSRAAAGGGGTLYGFDFRATSGYVTDPTNNTYSVGDLYPQTRNGITFGWDTAPTNVRDRSTSVDHRLAGVNIVLAAQGIIHFQIDLPSAGSYQIGLASGDASFAGGVSTFSILDNTTSKYSFTTGSVTTNQYRDINNNLWTSDSAFFAGQTYQTITFASTTFKLAYSASISGSLAHLEIIGPL